MMGPLYINDFSLHCILGSASMADNQDVFDKLKNGTRGNFTIHDVAGVMRPAATIDPASLPAVENKVYDNRVNRLSQAALCQMDGTIRNAVEKYGANRIGIFLGSCDNGSEASLAALKCFKETGSFPEGYKLDYQRADFPARFIADRYGIQGMISVHSTACASSASAFVAACNNIYAGNCDAAIVGGVDIASLPVILGFAFLEAMSDKPTNPFSANRSGLTLGDAAVFFLVTREPDKELYSKPAADSQSAANPETGNCFQLVGCGESADADHITAPRADGEGAYQAMMAALRDAGLSPEQIGYVNLHGTGTRLNDAMESRAVNRIFGSEVPASSTKALTGHTLGAAGALEAAFCCMAMQHGGVLPSHLFDGCTDPELPKVKLAAAGDQVENLEYCMSNSFAFGGCNVSLILKNG